jgi:pilus assembly protein CpaE
VIRAMTIWLKIALEVISSLPRFRASDGGVAAIEFGIVAPVLFFSMVLAADLGFAFHERMTVDHTVRAGAQAAMADLGAALVRTTMEGAASKHFSVSSATSCPTDGTLCFTKVEEVCECTSGVETACSTATATCPKYYNLRVEKTRKNMLFPSDFKLEASMRVQVR